MSLPAVSCSNISNPFLTPSLGLLNCSKMKIRTITFSIVVVPDQDRWVCTVRCSCVEERLPGVTPRMRPLNNIKEVLKMTLEGMLKSQQRPGQDTLSVQVQLPMIERRQVG